MKISLIATALILAAAWVITSGEDRKVAEMKTRLDQRIASVETARASSRQGRVAMDEEAKRKNAEETAAIKDSAMELLEWMRQFHDPANPNADPGTEQRTEIYRRVDEMTATQAAFILEEFVAGRGMDQFPGPLLIASGLTKLAAEFPLAAVHFFEVLEKRRSSAVLLKEIGVQVIGDSVIAMAKDNPEVAAKWLRENGSRFENHITPNTKLAMLFNIARHDPEVAFRLIPELDLGGSGHEIAAIVRAAGTDDERRSMLSSLRQYLGTKVEGSARQEALAKGFEGFVDRLGDGGAAVTDRWLASVKLSGDEMDALVDGMGRWAAYRPSGEWMNWLVKTATPGKHDAHVHKVFTAWSEEDYRASGEWLVKAPEGRSREIAVQAYAEAAAKYDPQTAAQWAESLPVGKRREETLRKVLNDWPVELPDDVQAKAAFAKRNGF